MVILMLGIAPPAFAWVTRTVRLTRRREEADQFADRVVLVLGVAERELIVDRVAVAAPDARLRQVAVVLQVSDDLRGGSLGDPDGAGDVPQARVRVGGDAGEDMGVVGDESPPPIVIPRT
jgi:hypothetical protein